MHAQCTMYVIVGCIPVMTALETQHYTCIAVSIYNNAKVNTYTSACEYMHIQCVYIY